MTVSSTKDLIFKVTMLSPCTKNQPRLMSSVSSIVSCVIGTLTGLFKMTWLSTCGSMLATDRCIGSFYVHSRQFLFGCKTILIFKQLIFGCANLFSYENMSIFRPWRTRWGKRMRPRAGRTATASQDSPGHDPIDLPKQTESGQNGRPFGVAWWS